MQEKGFFWHVHHEVLLEWCYSYNERAHYIMTSKPKRERELRIRLFKSVRGALPDALLLAGEALDTAREAHDEASRSLEKARDAFERASEAFIEAWRVLGKAGDVLENAQAVYVGELCVCRTEIEALHKLECPDCPWDGFTIFS